MRCYSCMLLSRFESFQLGRAWLMLCMRGSSHASTLKSNILGYTHGFMTHWNAHMCSSITLHGVMASGTDAHTPVSIAKALERSNICLNNARARLHVITYGYVCPCKAWNSKLPCTVQLAQPTVAADSCAPDNRAGNESSFTGGRPISSRMRFTYGSASLRFPSLGPVLVPKRVSDTLPST